MCIRDRRRLADEHAHHSPDGSLCVHALDWLTQSLKLDLGDRDTHLRLLRDARLSDDLKQARRWLDDALRQFPGDALILQEAVETALAAGAYKKAAGLAKQVLDCLLYTSRQQAIRPTSGKTASRWSDSDRVPASRKGAARRRLFSGPRFWRVTRPQFDATACTRFA